jgi:hypothetical protein
MESRWQKIGQHGELLAIDVPQWSAVIDKKTQLMWAINTSKTANFPNPKNEITWDDAQVWVAQVNKSSWCGFTDWRLPTIDELKTLLTTTKQRGLYLDKRIFNVVSRKYYGVWSSSPVPSYSNLVWIVTFGNGNGYFSDKSNNLYVLIVRSGQ